ncbi:hypothetical protein GBK02_09175 [Dechloromonas sp. TW-R-39-2]|uniref:phage tail length tape measure family protein n=1 Tax=Dechloromonas sp. TW-R-39-2 TaxID=2654218 RepID=UPI00193E0AE4|nr:phage tail length tape measure family protein [Dechloromonas sp. TW-R-39-2]QRM19561.1 hypothetical protein GBK02_09175 [Dechloromonas sp. TW-R-39-2]
MTDKIRIPLVVEGFGQVETTLNGLVGLLGKTEAAAKTSATGTAAHFSKVSSEMEKVGQSSAQMNAALRNVPAQFTDIITSLTSGQSPMTVFMQQGGQLKDMFGGAGAAAKALGGYVLGMINPMTAGAAAAAAIGYAYYQAGEEAKAMSKAVTMTGNAMGLTTGQMGERVKGIADSTKSTYGSVSGAVASLVSTGSVAEGALDKVAKAAIYLEKSGVQASEETVKQFAELGKSPVDASARLNTQYHYLTASVYAQIKALEEQGKMTQAAALAQNTFADAMIERSKGLIGELGTLEKAWNSVIGSAKSAWDTMLGVGRKESDQDQLVRLKNMIELKRSGVARFDPGSRAYKVTNDELNALLEQQAAIEKRVAAENNVTKAKADQNAKDEAGIKWLRDGEAFQSNRQRMEQEVAKARQNGLAAGISELEIQKRIAEIRKKYVGGDDKSALDVAMNSRIKGAKQGAKDSLDEIDSLFKRKEIGIDESLARKYSTNAASLGSEYGAIQGRIDKGALEPAQKLQLMERQREILREIVMLEKQYQRDVEETNTRPAELIKEYQRQNQVVVERINRESELSLMTERQRVVAEALYKVEDDGAKVRNDIIKNMPDGIAKTKALADAEGELASQIERVSAATSESYDRSRSFEYGFTKTFQRYQDEATNAAKTAETVFVASTNAMADAGTKFAMGQKVSFTDMASTFVSQLIRIQMQAAAAQVTSSSGKWFSAALSMIGSYFSGGAGSGGPQTASESAVGADINSAGMGGFAKGGAFGASGLHAFANGGTFTNKIFSEPTFFKFANGSKFGVMGEAGDEAVMPLARDSSGRLGVRAQGGQQSANQGIGSIRVVIENNGTEQQIDSANTEFDFEGMVLHVVTSDVTRDGKFAQTMQRQYNINRANGAYG